MSATAGFERSVFVNCPFDEDFEPILQAMLFCLVDCDLVPRIATERLDSGEARLDKIVELIRACRYSIHDLSRLQASAAGEFARLNMPFELGIDYGHRVAGDEHLAMKRTLITAATPYDYRMALSDIAGWDIRCHDDDYQTAIREVRRWLNSLRLAVRSPTKIKADYEDFQEWDLERLDAGGWALDDILDRGTGELLDAMQLWVRNGRPVTFT